MLSGMHTQASRLKRTRRVVLSEGEEEGQPQAEVARNDENDVAIQVRQVNLRRLRRAHISTSEEEEDELPAAEIARDEIIPVIIKIFFYNSPFSIVIFFFPKLMKNFQVFGFEKDDSLEELTFRDTNREEYMKRERVVIGIAQSAIEDGNREIKEQCTVFGFAANSNPSPQEFVGGVRFFKEDTEKAAAVKAIIAHVIKQYEASHQGQHPSEVVIYWNGQTEGEMSKVLDEVINGRLQQAFAQLPRAPQWTFIMTVERQDNIPIFKTDVRLFAFVLDQVCLFRSAPKTVPRSRTSLLASWLTRSSPALPSSSSSSIPPPLFR
ncbi:hypothetical protein WR25_20761 isoform B [Diploscapter pachys]|nr:hypothetical protein WR25_20761 isoform B [Diploscapter pachys]